MSCFITLKINIAAPDLPFTQDRTKSNLRGVHAWDSFCESHSYMSSHHYMSVSHSCPGNVSPFRFWSPANQFSNLVSRLHVQITLMGNFGLNGRIPLLQNTDGVICFICKEDNERVTCYFFLDCSYFFLDCSYFRNNFESLWNKLEFKNGGSNPTYRVYICNFIESLEEHNEVLLLLGGLLFPSIMKQILRLANLFPQLLVISLSFVTKD